VDDEWLVDLAQPQCIGYEIPAGTAVRVAKASERTPQWRSHVLRLTLRFQHTCRPASEGAFFKHEDWLIATTWDKVRELTR